VRRLTPLRAIQHTSHEPERRRWFRQTRTTARPTTR
jgi:hypothetical protein